MDSTALMVMGAGEINPMISCYKNTHTDFHVTCEQEGPLVCDYYSNKYEPFDGTCDSRASNGWCCNRQVQFICIEKLKDENGISLFNSKGS